MRHRVAHRVPENQRARGGGSAPRRFGARGGAALVGIVLGCAACHGGHAEAPAPARIDPQLSRALDAYGAEIRRLPDSGRLVDRAELGRALEALADAVAAIPDARTGDLPAAAADQVRVAALRIERGGATPPSAVEIESALVVTSTLLSQLARSPYGDAPDMAAHARALAAAVQRVHRVGPTDDLRVAVRTALEQARATLVAIGAEATKSPYPPRSTASIAKR